MEIKEDSVAKIIIRTLKAEKEAPGHISLTY